ncbi:hypothetical protein [Actinomadura sp. NPDC000600]|uniref:hypothetical protein n=1 Tax=Actinomadura sp. NPDC000600 TaxID=3154262 RepID=UPI003397B0D8
MSRFTTVVTGGGSGLGRTRAFPSACSSTTRERRFPRYEQTADGVERTYALNHHAPFLLTHALLAAGAFAPAPRIINLSTFMEKRGKLDRADPDVAGTWEALTKGGAGDH